MMVPFL